MVGLRAEGGGVLPGAVREEGHQGENDGQAGEAAHDEGGGLDWAQHLSWYTDISKVLGLKCL